MWLRVVFILGKLFWLGIVVNVLSLVAGFGGSREWSYQLAMVATLLTLPFSLAAIGLWVFKPSVRCPCCGTLCPCPSLPAWQEVRLWCSHCGVVYGNLLVNAGLRIRASR